MQQNFSTIMRNTSPSFCVLDQLRTRSLRGWSRLSLTDFMMSTSLNMAFISCWLSMSVRAHTGL